MQKTKLFLDQWILFEIFETETRGIFEINAGVAFNGKDVDLTIAGFDYLFGKSHKSIINFKKYGYNSINELKLGAIACLYFTCRSSAEKLVGQHIANLLRNSSSVDNYKPTEIIYEGRASDDPNKWSIYMDLRGEAKTIKSEMILTISKAKLLHRTHLNMCETN